MDGDDTAEARPHEPQSISPTTSSISYSRVVTPAAVPNCYTVRS